MNGMARILTCKSSTHFPINKCSFIFKRICHNKNSKKELFTFDTVCLGVYRIEEKYFESWNRANIYFIEGRDKNLLIDTGTGLFDLHDCITSKFKTTKPLTIFLTHIHFDHSGGIRHFTQGKSGFELCVNPDEIKYLTSVSDVKRKYATASWIMNYEVTTKSGEGKCQNFEREYNVPRLDQEIVQKNLRLVSEGDVIELGDLHGFGSYKVINLPGHTVGSIGLWNAKRSLLISGDSLYSTNEELIDWYPPGSSVTQFSDSVQRIMSITQSNTKSIILPGHNEVIVGRDMILAAGNRHIMSVSNSRIWLKFWSRMRASSILYVNALISNVLSLPDLVRKWIMK